ncbi:hypothetical protein A1F94_005402 [Pyrenophora tritici-repentis]|nr:hypothetical protein A1F94_005402 [Pyrenophora tritici-repentis]
MEAYNVKTRWAPGHMKIVGNELADQLADSEAKDPHQPYGMAASPTRSGIRTVGRRLLEHTRDTWWQDKSKRAPRVPNPHTRSEEPESPINTDLRGNKRRQRAHTRAEPSIGSTAPTSYNQAVSEAVRQRIQAAQKATNLHHSIITDLATAVDRCLGKYTDPDGARVARTFNRRC